MCSSRKKENFTNIGKPRNFIDMHCPSLKKLPSPPPGKTGWPWIEESPSQPNKMPNGQPWPKISIVTPSYNQGQFIEETIRSVLLQNYPSLEYIVMDGGSTDETISILKKYANRFSVWHSEKDNGHAHALNKGFEYATGFIQGFLNSDDLFLRGALKKVAELLAGYPGESILVLGDCEMGYSLGQIFDRWRPVPPKNFVDAVSSIGMCPQPATFWTRPGGSVIPRFNERLPFAFDQDFWCRLIKAGYKTIKLDAALAFYRHHPKAKGATIAGLMWCDYAGMSILAAGGVEPFKEKLVLAAVSRKRFHHYLRKVIEKTFLKSGRLLSLKALIRACLADPGMLLERPTLGLARKLLLKKKK